MIIQAIRLKNIRSYGAGADGEGITIRFRPGVNRIAGRNGHGKSTLIESLGYAMFLAEPQCLENFDLATYFLRTGCKAGEIDVTFSHESATYRVERGLGSQNKRRAKVVLVDDGSICAEDEREVSAFLCRLLGFKDPQRFSDVFVKLLGVKQGHLTRPFDSKPSQAKDFFEPLLEVEVFRQCYDRIKPAVDHFQGQRAEQGKLLAGVEERIRERRDSPAALAGRQEAVTTLEDQRRLLTEALATLQDRKEHLEAQAAAIAEAARQRDEAQRACGLQEQQRIHAGDQVTASREAAAALARLEPGYQACLAAEARLKELRTRQDRQRRLEAQRGEWLRQQAELAAQTQAALGRADLFAGQQAARATEQERLRNAHTALRQRLESGESAFQTRRLAAREAEQAMALLRPFNAGLPRALARQQRLLDQILTLEADLAAWDPAALQTARDQEAQADQQAQDLASRVAGLGERHRNLDQQLREIGNGVCPFLKERCRQFDPAKVEADLDRLAGELPAQSAALGSARAAAVAARTRRETLERLAATLDGKRKQLAERTGEFRESLDLLVANEIPRAGAGLCRWAGGLPPFPARPDRPGEPLERQQAALVRFQELVEAWWAEAETAGKAALEAEAQAAQARLRDQQDAANQEVQLGRLAEEAAGLDQAEQNERQAAADLAQRTAAAGTGLAACAEALAAFAGLDQDIALQSGLQEAHRADYLDYLGHKPAALRLAAAEADLEACQGAERAANQTLAARTEALADLQRAFDPQALGAATAAFLAKSSEAAACLANLQHAQEALERERTRHGEWLAACSVRDRILLRTARLQAAEDLGELARNVLKNAAPAVAQHLCTAIAGRAQGIFNLINHDPVELQWNSSRYSLRILPGERRFAMLSGGEQTKLALAMTLAMIQAFSDLRFCIFDEPTYGVDADSRARLADAILAAQEAAGLDQLLLVSHDDAFEGRIEHAILLTKTAAGGTEAVLEG